LRPSIPWAVGVTDGIERSTKLMVPSIALPLAALAVWAGTLDGGAAGYAYYFSPDLDALRATSDLSCRPRSDRPSSPSRSGSA